MALFLAPLSTWWLRSVVTVVAMATMAFAGSASATESSIPDRPAALIEPINHDFGRVRKGEVIRATFKVRNVGGRPLVLERVDFSHPDMKIRVAQTIAPGATEEAVIEWNTERVSGDLLAAARLQLNDPLQPQIVLGLSGQIVSPIEVLPRPALYFSQFVGEAATRSLEIRNHQDHAVAITGIERLGEHFTPRLEAVEPGKHWRLHVTVPASTDPGRYREALRLLTDDAERSQIHIEINVLVKPPLFANPEIVDFGTVSLRTVSTQKALLEALTQIIAVDRKSGSMSVTGVESDLPAVALQLDPPQGPAQRFRLDVSLDAGKLETGPLNGTITLHTDDPENPRLEIPVRGLVVD